MYIYIYSRIYHGIAVGDGGVMSLSFKVLLRLGNDKALLRLYLELIKVLSTMDSWTSLSSAYPNGWIVAILGIWGAEGSFEGGYAE